MVRSRLRPHRRRRFRRRQSLHRARARPRSRAFARAFVHAFGRYPPSASSSSSRSSASPPRSPRALERALARSNALERLVAPRPSRASSSSSSSSSPFEDCGLVARDRRARGERRGSATGGGGCGVVWSRDPWNAWEVHVEVGGGTRGVGPRRWPGGGTWRSGTLYVSRDRAIGGFRGWGYVEVWNSIRES